MLKCLIFLCRTRDGSQHEMSGQYIVSYDPEYHFPDGSYDGGDLICTMKPLEAGRFTEEEAKILIDSGPTCDCHRIQPNGMRNRPLRAFLIRVDTEWIFK